MTPKLRVVKVVESVINFGEQSHTEGERFSNVRKRKVARSYRLQEKKKNSRLFPVKMLS